MHPRRSVLALDDDLAVGKRCLDVAAVVALMTRDVRRLRRLLLSAGSRAVHAELFVTLLAALADDRRVRLQCRHGVDSWFERLVFDLHRVRAVFGGGFVLGQDNRHGLADVRRAIQGHHDAAVFDRLADVGYGQVLGFQHAHDTWHRFGSRRVDRHDARRGVRTAHQPRVQQPRQDQVAGEAHLSGETLGRVRPL